jgi:hypothetical protein
MMVVTFELIDFLDFFHRTCVLKYNTLRFADSFSPRLQAYYSKKKKLLGLEFQMALRVFKKQ